MRRSLVALVLLLAAPLAAAQSVLPSGSVTLLADPIEERLEPGGPPAVSRLVVEVSCDASAAAGRIVVDYAITQVPAWAVAAVEPAHDEADVSRCQDGFARFEAQLLASASPDAPAFRPEPIGVQVQAAQPLRPVALGETSVVVWADYFSIVDAVAESTLLEIDRGASESVRVRFTNHGNANTRLDFELIADGHGVTAHPANPITLESRQAGGTSIADDVDLWIDRSQDATGAATVLLRWRAAYALERSIVGDSGSIVFTLPAPGTEVNAPPRPPGALIDDVEARVPMPPAALVLALAALVALLVRR